MEEKSHLYRLKGFIEPYRVRFYLSIASSILNKIFDLMPPLLVGWIIDSVRGEAPGWIRFVMPSQSPFHMAAFLSGLAVIIFMFESFFQWGYQFGFYHLAQKIQRDLRLKVYEHLQKRELAFYENHPRYGGLHVVIHSLKKCLQSHLLGDASQAVSTTTALLRTGYKLAEPNKRYI
jgi:ATP-binding cassette subfamily B protein